MDDLIGQKIGRFEVRALLGVGGTGEVYAAYDQQRKATSLFEFERWMWVPDSDEFAGFWQYPPHDLRFSAVYGERAAGQFEIRYIMEMGQSNRALVKQRGTVR